LNGSGVSRVSLVLGKGWWLVMALITIQRIVVENAEQAVALKRSRRWRQRTGLASVIVLLGTMTFALTADASSPPATDVPMVALAASHQVTGGTTIGALKSVSFTVAGAPTPVPDDATTVQLYISITGSAGGLLEVYPAGNNTEGTRQVFGWLGGHNHQFAHLNVNVGTKNEVTFYNSSTGSATVSVNETAYSTYVSPFYISPTGGNPGDVLTNTGGTTRWQQVSADNFSPNGGNPGDVLTNTGAGTAWQTPASPGVPTAYVGRHTASVDLAVTNQVYAVVSTPTLPAGSYAVTATLVVQANGDQVECAIAGYQVLNFQGASTDTGGNDTVAITDAVQLSAPAPITIDCHDDDGTAASVGGMVVLAIPVNGVVAAGH
jgi:hypothetical protein